LSLERIEKQLTKYSIRERNIAGAISRRDDATTIDDDEANYDDYLIIPLIHTPFLSYVYRFDIFVIDVSSYVRVVVVAVAAEIVQMLLLAVMAMMTIMMMIGTVTKRKKSLS
jgi:hypothetical protein